MRAIICNKCKKIISGSHKEYFHGTVKSYIPRGGCLGESEYDICSECFELVREFPTETTAEKVRKVWGEDK